MVEYCQKCITPSTRPRVVFDENGTCNACNWAEKKKSIDWNAQRGRLKAICQAHRNNHPYNIIIPVSGGKDGSYVAWKMKHEFGMNPLCVTFSPPIQTELGRRNLESFRGSGFDLLEIRPNPEVYRKLCKRMFIEQARCKFPFVIGIGTAIAKEALMRNIPLIIYGEEGETEYGGSDKFESNYFLNDEYLKIYHENHSMIDYTDEFNVSELSWWIPPPIEKMKELYITWWSKYESWDDKLHADLAIDKCGLRAQVDSSIGTFTDYAQIDDVLQDLHIYECFIKFGTGRTTAERRSS
jgi:N-acetyl sugar amidotransferase